MWQMHAFLKKRWRKKAEVTRHFVQRLYERFAHDEMLRVIVELNELFRHDMYLDLLEPGASTKVPVQNAYTMCIAAKGARRITLKTIY
jgi:hypothetical protein